MKVQKIKILFDLYKKTPIVSLMFLFVFSSNWFYEEKKNVN
jgi:hypothetical protein